MQTEITVKTFEVHDLVEYINWVYFFHAWGFPPKYSSIADIHGCDSCRAMWLVSFPEGERSKASEAMQLHKEAVRFLMKLDGKLKVYAVYRLLDANSDGDNIVLNGDFVFPLLRQQSITDEKNCFLCLSDFVRPLNSGITDTVGCFATTVDKRMEELFYGDEYSTMLCKTLSERLAEAAAERIHEIIRKEIWAYAPHEKLSIKEILMGDYCGIRPAVGYPSLPDMSVNFLLDELLDMKRIGISLTDNGMMYPNASVSGLILAHPEARYFSVGKIDSEQLADYALRRGKSICDISKFLRANI